MTQSSGPSAPNATTDFSHTLFHNDLSALPLGSLSSHIHTDAAAAFHVPAMDPTWPEEGSFRIIERGLGKYIEAIGASAATENRLLIAGDSGWKDYRLRAVVTPLSFDGAGATGGICGIVARYRDFMNYVALVLDRDGQLKLLERRDGRFDVLASSPLEFCLGQSLTLTLTFCGTRAHGTAGPYTGATHVHGSVHLASGRVGYVSDVPARFGPVTVECSEAEAAALASAKANSAQIIARTRSRFPKMRLERTVPLRGLASGRNIRLADVNGDGRLEIIAAQSSSAVAQKFSMTRLTCLSVLDLDGKLLWQAGVPNDNAATTHEPDQLPFQTHDLYGDGGRVVVCVFGYDVQIRDGRSGKVLFSAATPDMQKTPVGLDFKEVTSSFGAPWGDESLNMNVAALAFCDTHGSGRRHEIIVKDDFHHLAVLDALSSPALLPVIRHRGNHGSYPWIGDCDGDGREEILAGCSLLDDTGRSAWSLPLGANPTSVAILDPLNAGGENRRLLICAGGQFYMLNSAGLSAPLAPAQIPQATGNGAQRLSVARFRADLPGLQILTQNGGSGAGLTQLYDASGKRLWSREFMQCGSGKPVNWTGRTEELFVHAFAQGSGLVNGFGDVVVEAPDAKYFVDVATAFLPDGRDALLAWDREQLSIYVPDDILKTPAYKPVRPPAENTSWYAAMTSTPPGW